MLTPQIALFRFLKVIIIGLVTALLYGVVLFVIDPIFLGLGLSAGLELFLKAVLIMLAIGLINFIDLLSTSLISKEEYRHKSRSLWANTLSHVLLGVFLLPWLGVVIVKGAPESAVWAMVGIYLLVMRVGNGFWEVLYSASPTRTLKIYGELGTLLSLGLIFFYFMESFPSIEVVHLAVFMVAWLLLEFVWEHALGLIYYGFNKFYGVSFLHDFAITKTPQALEEELEESLEDEMAE